MNTLKKNILVTAFILISAVSFCQEKEIGFAVIEQVPIYPGCELLETNPELKKCMSDKISAYVSENFNTAIAASSNLIGRQRINMQFRINKDGIVDNVVARAPHPSLEEEAIRVINDLPDLKPGMQKGKTVGVIYSLPILFNVEETKAQQKARKKLERKNKKAKN